MNTQIQNAALNEQPPNKNKQSEKYKHDQQSVVQDKETMNIKSSDNAESTKPKSDIKPRR